MPNTPAGLPYPAATATPDVPRDIQALATALDPLAPTDSVWVYQSGATTSVPSDTTGTPVLWNTEQSDPEGMWAAGTPSRLTAQRAGKYHVQAAVGFASPGASPAGYREIQILKNGSAVARDRRTAVASASTVCAVSLDVDLAVGEYIEVQAVQNQGAALNTVSGLSWSRFQARYVGPVS